MTFYALHIKHNQQILTVLTCQYGMQTYLDNSDFSNLDLQ